MTNLLTFIPFLFVCFIAVGCQQDAEESNEPAPDVETDIQTIRDIIAERTAAIHTADTEKFIALYADNAIKVLPDASPLVGKTAIQDWMHTVFGELTLQEVDEILDVKVSGDLAARGKSPQI